MAKRMEHCDWCGEELGIYDAFGEIESCGNPECNRNQRDSYREREANIRTKVEELLDLLDEYIDERAEQDQYDRYR